MLRLADAWTWDFWLADDGRSYHLYFLKAPRRIDFMAELPRHQTGKLYKRLIRDAYWGKEGSKIV